MCAFAVAFCPSPPSLLRAASDVTPFPRWQGPASVSGTRSPEVEVAVDFVSKQWARTRLGLSEPELGDLLETKSLWSYPGEGGASPRQLHILVADGEESDTGVSEHAVRKATSSAVTALRARRVCSASLSFKGVMEGRSEEELALLACVASKTALLSNYTFSRYKADGHTAEDKGAHIVSQFWCTHAHLQSTRRCVGGWEGGGGGSLATGPRRPCRG